MYCGILFPVHCGGESAANDENVTTLLARAYPHKVSQNVTNCFRI